MDALKLKIEIGDRRFEADGPANVVTAHANAFMKLTFGGNAETIADEAAAQAKALQQASEKGLRLDRIMRVNGTEVSLNVLPQQSIDAAVTLMLGHRHLRNHHVVGGGEIARGLTASGRPMVRADQLMNACLRRNYVAAIGKNRGRRYQLTDAGVQRAEGIARGLIGALPTEA